MTVVMLTYRMETAGHLGYSIQPKNDHSSNKYAKGDLSYAYMQHHTCSNWQEGPTWSAKTHRHLQATILAASRVPTSTLYPHHFLAFTKKNYLYKLIDRI